MHMSETYLQIVQFLSFLFTAALDRQHDSTLTPLRSNSPG